MNYSCDPEVIDSYAALGNTVINVNTDAHASYRTSSSVDLITRSLPVWKTGTVTIVTDNGYVIDKLTVNGNAIPFTVNDNYQVTLDYAVDFARAGVQNIEVTTKVGQYIKATGKIVSENGNVEDATVRFIGNGKTLEGKTDKNGAYSVVVESNNTYTMEVAANGYFEKRGAVNIGASFEKDVTIIKQLFVAGNNNGTILYENAKYGLDDQFKSTDVTYTMLERTGAYNTELKSDKFLSNGQYFIYTLRFNPESNGYPGHAVKVSGSRQSGDQYIRTTIGGKAFDFGSSGCTVGAIEGLTSAQASGKQPFDFSMDKDFWENKPIYVTAYDFALTKEGNTVRMYGRYNGTTDWVLLYTTTTNDELIGFERYKITTAGGYTYNWSLANLVIGNNLADITNHVWEYDAADSYWGSAGRTTNPDGSHVYNLHVGTSSQQRKDAVRMPSDSYNAKDNVVTVTADYSIWGNNNDWSLAGWVFKSDNDHKISIMMRSDNGTNRFYLTTAGWGNGWPNRHTNLTAANPNNGLYVCNPNGLARLKNKFNQFSAKWVINGTRFKLYVGEYGNEANNLIFDIDWKEFWSKTDPTDGDNSSARRWGGSDANSADKKFPDMTNLKIGIQYCCDDSNANNSKNLIYAERFTVKENNV